MSLETDLAAAVAAAQADAAKLRQIVQGPPSGDASLVATEGGTVKTLARITAEASAAAGAGVVPFTLPIPWTTGLTAVVGPPATCVTFGGETYVCNTAHFTGATFVADAAKWTKITQKGDTGPAPYRNRFINGDFAIDQRNGGAAQTFTAGAAIAYTVDRWYASCTGANIAGQRVAGTGPNQYAYRFTGAASNTGLIFGQRIESIQAYDQASQNVVCSVQIKSSSLATLTWTAYYPTALDNHTAKVQIATGTLNISPALSNYSFTFNAGPNITSGLCVEFSAGALTGGNTLQFEAAQEELGTVATAFERRSFGERLRECLRYYTKSYELETKPGTATALGLRGGVYISNGVTAGLGMIPFRGDVPMRAAPTLSVWDAAGTSNKCSYSNTGVGGLTNNGTTTIVGAQTVSASGFFFGYTGSGSPATGSYFTHFAADAEL